MKGQVRLAISHWILLFKEIQNLIIENKIKKLKKKIFIVLGLD